MTKKEIKRLKELLRKPEEDLTDDELDELEELEEKLDSGKPSRNKETNQNKESEEMPVWAKKLMEKFDKREVSPKNKPIEVPIPPEPDPEQEPEPEPEPEPKKKKNSFLSWLM